MSLRVAFASTDGAYIDQHFGSARYFQVYDITGETYSMVETRTTPGSCHGHCDGGFENLLEALRDCDAIFVIRIGESAAAFMVGQGKRVFEAAGPVDLIIEQLIQSKLLESE